MAAFLCLSICHSTSNHDKSIDYASVVNSDFFVVDNIALTRSYWSVRTIVLPRLYDTEVTDTQGEMYVRPRVVNDWVCYGCELQVYCQFAR